MSVLRRRLFAPLAGIILAGLGLSDGARPQRQAATTPPVAAVRIKVVAGPNDYVLAALADALALSEYDRRYVRYLTNADTESMKTSSLTLNLDGRGSVIVRPAPVPGGLVVRVDLRAYAPRDGDLAEWLVLWEELAFDPMFSLLITKDNADFAARRGVPLPPVRRTRTVVRKEVVTPESTREEVKVIDHPGGRYTYPDDSGRVVDNVVTGQYRVTLKFRTPAVERKVTEEIEDVATPGAEVAVIRINGPGITPDLVRLQALTGSLAPVVDHRYFKTRALTAVKTLVAGDKAKGQVFKAVFGGLYYDLKGIKKAKDVLGKDTKATDLDLFFENLGIGNIQAGVTADKLFDRLRSDQRLAVFRSKITGKPRDVISFHVPADREGGAWGAITGDVGDEDIDIGDRAFANLLTPRRKAREAIFPNTYSLPVFALFNGDGALQDEVPPDVAADSTIPDPFTKRLQPGIGCIRCHWADGSDGWKPLVNDVKRLTAGKLDIFDDLGGRPGPDVIDRLAGLYAGDFGKNLRRARDDVAESSLRATGPWKDGGDQAEAARAAATKLCAEFAEYNYDLVDARKALLELGLDVPAERAVTVLNRVMPPDLRADAGGFVAEDPRTGALKGGIGINRSDFALAYSYMLERFQRSMAQHNGDLTWLDAN